MGLFGRYRLHRWVMLPIVSIPRSYRCTRCGVYTGTDDAILRELCPRS